MAKTGDIRKLTFKSVDQRVTVGSDFSRKAKWVKESQPTSGETDVKWTIQNQDIEGVEIQCSGAERAIIEDFTELNSLDCAYVTANGDTYTSSVTIDITDDGTQDGKLTVKIIPLTDWTGSFV